MTRFGEGDAARAGTRAGRVTIAALLGAVMLPAMARAQEGGWRRTALTSGVISESWRFATPLAADSLYVDRVQQLSIPLGFAVPLGGRWTVDLSGAYTRGSARLADSLGRNVRTLHLDGPTDVKLRVVGRLVGDAVVVSAGVNAPTGMTRLDDSEVAALRLIAAPALRMPSPSLGSGLGATTGIVLARQAGGWAFAAGASYEARASYTPIEIGLSAKRSVTDLDPSNAVHLTLGADRLLGAHRLSFLGSYDVYGEDRLTLAVDGKSAASGTYKLGPTVSVLSLLELGVPGFQEMSIAVVDRYRSKYRGLDGITAAGSSGNAVDVRLRARVGAARRMGWIFGADGRFDTGLDVDESLATAAVTAFGGSIGLSLPLGTVAVEPALRATVGTIDTGTRSTRATGIGFTILVVRR